MADIFDWSPTAGSNSTVDGVNVATGMPVNNVDNAIRSMMATIRQSFSSTLKNFLAGVSALPVASGGTGATTAADARTALSAAKSGANSDITALTGLTTALAQAYGGTGQTGAIFTVTGNATSGRITLSQGGSVVFRVMWGRETVGSNFGQAVSYGGFFTTFAVPILSAMAVSSGSDDENCGLVSGSDNASGFSIYNANNQTMTIPWLAVGV